MAEQIDELFVRLGLEQDKQSFDEAESTFQSLRATALQFGATIGTGLGLQELTFGFTQSAEEARRLAEEFRGLEVSPQFVNQLRGAFRLINEDAGEAESLIRNIAGIIEDTDWGEISSAAFARGFDISGIQEAESAAEVLRELNDQLSGADPRQARELGQALGLSSAQIRMLRDTNVSEGMSAAQEAAPLSDEMVKAGQEFQEGFTELSMAMDGLSRSISETFVGDLGENMSDMAEYLRENRDAITRFVDTALPYLRDTAIGVGALVAFRAARAGLGVLSNIPLATAFTAGGFVLGGQAIRGNLMDPNSESFQQYQNEQEAFKRSMPGMAPGMSLDEAEQWLNERDRRRAQERAEEQDQSSENDEPSLWDRIVDQLSGGVGATPTMPDTSNVPTMPDTDTDSAPSPEISMVPDITGGMSLQQVGDTINLSIENIDARGSTNPEQTRQQIRRAMDEAMSQAAKNTVRDIKSPVQ